MRAIRKATSGRSRVVILSQRDMTVEEPTSGDLAEIGVLSEIIQSMPLPDGRMRISLRGLSRVRAVKVAERSGYLCAQILPMEDLQVDGEEVEAWVRTAIDSFSRVVELNEQIPPESLELMVYANDPGRLADSILHHLPIAIAEKQRLLEEVCQRKRIAETCRMLAREERILGVKADIRSRLELEIAKSQRSILLREQLKTIQEELRDEGGGITEADRYRTRLDSLELPGFVAEKARQEIERLERWPAASPEIAVSCGYLDTVFSLPWGKPFSSRIDLVLARALLEERHYGIDRVKDRILDQLAVHSLKGVGRGSALCFSGPPGVGKTSLCRSIAEAMGREFVQISLGGMKDEAELKGHRRTYVGSMPGRIIQGLRDRASSNPVVLLDEIDKISAGQHGDPYGVLLELLDGELCRRFVDHYLEVPFDLSNVLFIATCNLFGDIPGPLRDRLEHVPFSSYTTNERCEIARRHLLPACLETAGLGEDDLRLSPGAIRRLATEFSREAGVRELGRQIKRVCEKAARAKVENFLFSAPLEADDLERLLGKPAYPPSGEPPRSEIGCAWGLVTSDLGGDVLPIEAGLLPPRGPNIEILLTGNLGNIMRESALTAFSHFQGQIPCPVTKDLHVHVAQGGIPKEGPSAGLAILAAIASAYYEAPLKAGFALTGEISLRGTVMAVGGIRDKVLAAAAAGLTDVILPKANAADLDEISRTDIGELRFHLVEDAATALELVLPHAQTVSILSRAT